MEGSVGSVKAIRVRRLDTLNFHANALGFASEERELAWVRSGRIEEDLVSQVLRFRHYPVDCIAGAVNVIVSDLSDGWCSHSYDKKRCKESGYPVHGAWGEATAISPSKDIRPSSLSNVR